eukprot:15324832-Heterocapsa_arctica.AAC.1
MSVADKAAEGKCSKEKGGLSSLSAIRGTESSQRTGRACADTRTGQPTEMQLLHAQEEFNLNRRR